jgi:nifR3 family TIM-barrel protein
MLQIGSLRVDPPLFLAPMAGVTDRDFRLIVRRVGGVGVVAMEFISSKGLMGKDRRVLEMLPFTDEERPLSIQIYGGDAETMIAAARQVEQLGPDLCDINMGCPANAVLAGCAGAALMGDLRQAERILTGVRRALSIPVTVKFRLGLDENRRNYLELGRIAEAVGLDAVALHARTARAGFRGAADWSHIARLKEAVQIPVLGNGDVTSADAAMRLFAETGCDGVMIGRAATRNPWIFAEIAARLGPGGRVPAPTLADRRDLVLGHFRTVAKRDGPGLALHKLRKFTGWYAQGLPGGHALRRRINDLRTVEQFLDEVEVFFDRTLDECREAA